MATSLARHCEGPSLRDWVGTPAFTGVHGCRIDTKSKNSMLTRTSGRQKCNLTVLELLLYEQ